MNIPIINNRKSFLFQNHPEYHPESLKYIEYWRFIKGCIINGYWGKDCKDGEDIRWRFMPPQLFFYVNCCYILHKEPGSAKTSPRKKVHPNLDDVEWAFFYAYLEARGFSGFKDDDNYTCCREVELYHKGKYNEIDLPLSVFNKKGIVKQYIPAREYLLRTFHNPLGLPLYDNEAKNLILLSARGLGKDLEENTIIYSVDRGKIPIKDVKVGEFIYGADGKPTKVLERFDYNDQKQYKITQADGRSLIAGEGHLWKVIDNYGKELIVDTATIRDNYKAYIRKTHNGKYNFDSRYFIPMNEGIDSPDVELPIDPYFLGLWLGDGSKHTTGITTIDEEIKNYVYEYCKNFEGHKVSINMNIYKTCPTYTITSSCDKTNSFKNCNLLLNKFKELELINNKHIPNIYFNSSYNQRLELLKGLMDSDGYISKEGNHIEFSSSIEKLAKNVIELGRTLGIRVEYTTRIPHYKDKNDNKVFGKNNYRIKLKPRINVFKLNRKSSLFKELLGAFSNSTHNKIAIKNVEEVGIRPSVCITVDNKDKLFLAGDYMVTHNSYWISDGCILHEIITDGAKEYTEESIKNPAKVEIFVGAAMASKSSEMLEKTQMALDNLPGIWKKGSSDEIPSPLYKKMSGTLAPNNIKNPWKSEYEKKIAGEWKKVGSGSNVKHGIWTIENPEAAAGGRYNLVVCEEVGLLPNSIDVHMSNIPTQYIEHKFGTAIYLGTSGNMEKIQQTQIMFCDPEGFDMLEFDDEWEGTGKIGFFIPATYSNRKFKDENGNTVLEEAEKYYNSVREKKRKAKSGSALDMEMMNYPLIPSEMFLNKAYNKFPISDLKHTLSTLLTNDKLLNTSWRGFFNINPDDGKITWTNTDNYPIREFPLRNKDNIEGCWEIFSMPIVDNDGMITSGRYITSCLPPGEKVLTNTGLKNIESISLDEKLINQDGNQVSIDKLIRHNVKNEDIYTFKIANTYRKTTFTKEHPLLVSKVKLGYVSYPKSKRLKINQRYKRFDFNYKTADTIGVGEWIKYPNVYLSKNEENILNLWDDNNCRIDRRVENPLNKEDFWWMMGLILGDGWADKNGYGIEVTINNNETQYINKFEKIVNDLFKRKISKTQEIGCVKCRFNCKQLNTFINTHFGKFAIGKYIPEWAKRIDNNLKLSLLLGYLDSDGCITKTDKYYSTEFVSINLRLLEDFQDILFSLGIISSITKLRDKKYNVNIAGNTCNTLETYHLRIAHKDSVELAKLWNNYSNLKISRIDFSDESIHNTQKQTMGCFFSEDLKYIYFKIESIEKATYTGTVYNFECNTHTFLCKHITTHNCDPIDDDDNSDVKRSLQSAFIFDTFTDKIVAEYTGRSKFAKDYYEQLRRGLLFYNARLLYENQKKGLFQYFDQKNCLYLLEDTPEMLKDVDMQKISLVGNRSKGVYMTAPLIRWGIDLYAQWLMSQATGKEDGVTNAHTLRSVGLIRESIIYSRDINTDRISSIIVLMIYRESRIKYTEKKKNAPKNVESSINTFMNKHWSKKL